MFPDLQQNNTPYALGGLDNIRACSQRPGSVANLAPKLQEGLINQNILNGNFASVVWVLVVSTLALSWGNQYAVSASDLKTGKCVYQNIDVSSIRDLRWISPDLQIESRICWGPSNKSFSSPNSE